MEFNTENKYIQIEIITDESTIGGIVLEPTENSLVLAKTKSGRKIILLPEKIQYYKEYAFVHENQIVATVNTEK